MFHKFIDMVTGRVVPRRHRSIFNKRLFWVIDFSKIYSIKKVGLLKDKEMLEDKKGKEVYNYSDVVSARH